MNFISIGALQASLSVMLGAFGAHAIRSQVSAYEFEIYQTATHYFFLHAIALILYGLWGKGKNWVGIGFILGSVIFSGSLFLIIITQVKLWGAITPIGGMLFILSWLGFAMQARKKQ